MHSASDQAGFGGKQRLWWASQSRASSPLRWACLSYRWNPWLHPFIDDALSGGWLECWAPWARATWGSFWSGDPPATGNSPSSSGQIFDRVGLALEEAPSQGIPLLSEPLILTFYVPCIPGVGCPCGDIWLKAELFVLMGWLFFLSHLVKNTGSYFYRLLIVGLGSKG